MGKLEGRVGGPVRELKLRPAFDTGTVCKQPTACTVHDVNGRECMDAILSHNN